LHFSGQGNPTSWKARSIGLFDRQVKVRCLEIVGYFVAQRWEKLADNIVPRESLSVFRFEELLPNNSFSVDKEIPGPRHPFILSGTLGVQNVIGPNGFRIGIGEQRKINFATVCERLHYFHAVVADCRQLDPLLFKSCFCVLQLDQLPFAVRSPIGRANK
jgi:hypothetical protein